MLEHTIYHIWAYYSLAKQILKYKGLNDLADIQDDNSQTDANLHTEESDPVEEITWFDAVQGAALVAKTAFPDQVDYYNPEEDEII